MLLYFMITNVQQTFQYQFLPQLSNDNERAIPGGYRYSSASGGVREKRELGCLSEEAVRSSRYDQCCACRHYRAQYERRC